MCLSNVRHEAVLLVKTTEQVECMKAKLRQHTALYLGYRSELLSNTILLIHSQNTELN